MSYLPTTYYRLRMDKWINLHPRRIKILAGPHQYYLEYDIQLLLPNMEWRISLRQNLSILEGLMQGTVNSLLLFNIFTYEVPKLFNTNMNNNLYSIAFADDFILLVAKKRLYDSRC